MLCLLRHASFQKHQIKAGFLTYNFVHSQLVTEGRNIVCIYVDRGAQGSENPDQMHALNRDHVGLNIRLSKQGCESIVCRHINQLLQQQWEQETRGKPLYALQNTIFRTRYCGGNRREDFILR